MQHDRHQGAERAKGAKLSPPGLEPVVADDLDDVDPIQVSEDGGRKLRAPPDTDPIDDLQSPPPPPQPPQPPPPHPEPQPDPQLLLVDQPREAFGKS